jgi:hypothetical protein
MPRTPHNAERRTHRIPDDFYAIGKPRNEFPLVVIEFHRSILAGLIEKSPATILENLIRHMYFPPHSLIKTLRAISITQPCHEEACT